jgi:hypothetical protein
MRYRVLILVLCMAPVGLFAQASSPGWQNLPPGFVNGSKTPELIPDTAAYRLVFLSLTVPPSADAKTQSRQTALIAQAGLSEADATTLKNAKAAFAGDYSAWQASARAAGSTATTAQISSQVTALVQRYQSLLVATLSTDGATKLSQFVQSAKARMVVRP